MSTTPSERVAERRRAQLIEIATQLASSMVTIPVVLDANKPDEIAEFAINIAGQLLDHAVAATPEAGPP